MNFTVVRLALTGSRGSWGRLLGIVGGVAVGVALLLLLLGASGAMQARDLRSSWLNPSGEHGTTLTNSTVLVSAANDRHDGADIRRLDVAATPGSTVEIPGIPDAPRDGEFYASPALIERIESVPADQLGDRFGTLVGTLPDSVLKSPDSLVAVAGMSPEVLAERHSTMIVSEFPAVLFGDSVNYQIVAVIGAIAVLFPVLLLVSIVARLGAAERRERFATLRLIGASPGTVTMIAAWETLATSLIGALLGVVLYIAVRPLAAMLSVDGGTFYIDDLTVPPPVAVLAVVLTAGASTLVAALRVAKADIGPLGGSRQQHESTPRARRLVPLALGVALMAGASFGPRLLVVPLLFELLLVLGFVLMAVGLLVAGPYLTLAATRLGRRRASSAAGMIAASRIARAPVATFRSVSGLVIAVFTVSLFAGAATTAAQDATIAEGPGLLPRGTVLAVPSTAQTFERAELERVEGVAGVAVLHSAGDSSVLSADDAALIGLTDLPDTPFVEFSGNFAANDPSERSVTASSVTTVDGFPALTVLVVTDGSTAAVERVRTWIENSGIVDMGTVPPGTREDAVDTAGLTMVNSFATLAYLGVGIAVFIAGVSLAIATAAAVLDRRRVLGLLRLIGMPVSGIRRIVALEALIPLLAVLALSVALGLGTAWLLLTGLTDGRRTVGWPDPRYYVALGGSLLLSIAAVAATFGTIRRNTAISSTRFE